MTRNKICCGLHSVSICATNLVSCHRYSERVNHNKSCCLSQILNACQPQQILFLVKDTQSASTTNLFLVTVTQSASTITNLVSSHSYSGCVNHNTPGFLSHILRACQPQQILFLVTDANSVSITTYLVSCHRYSERVNHNKSCF